MAAELFNRLRSEFGMLARFGVVGLAATAVHASIAWWLIGTPGLPTLAANLLAFAGAFWVSFLGHFHWTFANLRPDKGALARFLVISSSGFAFNNVVLLGLLAATHWRPENAAVLAALAVPAWTFFASRGWGFVDRHRHKATSASAIDRLAGTSPHRSGTG